MKKAIYDKVKIFSYKFNILLSLNFNNCFIYVLLKLKYYFINNIN